MASFFPIKDDSSVSDAWFDPSVLLSVPVRPSNNAACSLTSLIMSPVGEAELIDSLTTSKLMSDKVSILSHYICTRFSSVGLSPTSNLLCMKTSPPTQLPNHFIHLCSPRMMRVNKSCQMQERQFWNSTFRLAMETVRR